MSYGTFVPWFTIDTEYLRSLLEGKGYSCELTESASIKSYQDCFPPSPKLVSPTPTLPSSVPTKLESGVDITYSSSPVNVIDFLSECRTQLNKLDTFMEHNLTRMESELVTLKRKMSIDRLTNSAPHPVERSYSANSDDSGVADYQDGETVKLISSKPHREDYVEVSVGVLSRLRKALLSLEKSLTSSFAALDQLVSQYDEQTLSREGHEMMQSHNHLKQKHERRLNRCLENVDSELNLLQRGQSINIDGLGRVHTYDQESLMNVKIAQSRSCIPFFIGALFIIILGVVSFMYLWAKPPTWSVYLRFLRGPLLILLCIYLFGINIRTWASSNISYMSIFKYNPKGAPTPDYMFKVAGIFTTFFSALIVVLLVVSPFTTHYIGNMVPLLLWLSLFVFLFNPLNILLQRARFCFIRVCVRILLAPFTSVRFGDFFLADQLNSTVGIMLDMQYLLCYTFTGPWSGRPNETICTSSGNGIRPIISCLPAAWRLLQCFRCYYDTGKVSHLLNAGKYFTTFPVIVFATLFASKVKILTFNLAHLDLDEVGWIIIAWLVASFIHAVYTFIWDIYCDWGLWNFSKGTFFRPRLIYHHKIVYLLAIVMDLILRFLWTMKLTMAIVWHLDSDLIYTGIII